MYKISNTEREQYGSIILLDEMINGKAYFPILAEGNEKHLDPLFRLLNKNNLIRVEGQKYVPTPHGREHLVSFYKKYWEFIRMYDLYLAVDLEAGEFAFSEFFNMGDDEWTAHLDHDRWEDVRIAVCEFKGINPIEVIFASFINEDRFDLGKEGWEFDLVSGLIWDEIEEVANNNLTVEQLEENDTEVKVLIEMGAHLAKELYSQEKEQKEKDAELDEEDEEDDIDEEVEEVITYVEIIEEDESYYNDDFYEPFFDPYYVPDYWAVPILYVDYY